MNPANLVRVITFVVTTLYTIVLYFTRSSISGTPAQILSCVPTAIGLGILVFDLWVWRFPGVHWFVKRPWIAGTWIGTLRPNPESKIPPDGNRGPIPVALVIEQSYWSIGITLMSSESSSQSTSASLRSDADSPGRRVLAYTYVNMPKQEHRNRSPAHAGACQLRVVGRIPIELNGTYWTDRLTAGDGTFQFVSREVEYASFEAVAKADAVMKKKAVRKQVAKKVSRSAT
jgi:hypothetical protein